MEETREPAEGDDAGAGRFGRAKEFVGEKYAAASDAVKEKYS